VLATSLKAHAAVKRSQVESANVVARLPGADPALKGEVVVLSAHVDHIGIGEPIDGDRIYNGAMDNGSGSALLVDIAANLAASGQAPGHPGDRTITPTTTRAARFWSLSLETSVVLLVARMPGTTPPATRLISQTPCTTITDRNLQLSCYGISVKPNFPSNCRDITDVDMKQFCYGAAGVANTDLGQCTSISARNTQLLCYAMNDSISSNCNDITNANDRNFCLGVSAHNTSYCASIQ